MRIIYFDLDCVRSDHLGVYGYQRPTSPTIDELAKQSMVFENCFTSDAPCLPSRAALFSCRPGISNGVVSHEHPGCNFRFPAKEGMNGYYNDYTMPMRLLQQNDFHTVTFSVFAQRHCAMWFNSGFSEVSNPTRPSSHENAKTINPRVIKWLENNGNDHENSFLHIHYWDAHTSYDMDNKEYIDEISKYDANVYPCESGIQNHYQNSYGPKTARDIMIRNKNIDYKSGVPALMPDEISNREDYLKMLNSYDGSILRVDTAIKEIIDKLKELDMYDDTAIIISGDHGEAIGQFGMYFEHGLAVDGVAKVPLIVHWPKVTTKLQKCDKLVYQYDFMATIMDMIGIDIPSRWHAKSFKDLLEGKAYDGEEYIVYGCGIFTLQRAVRTKKYAYIKTFNAGCMALDDSYLFDIENDPDQTTDIKDKYPEIADQMEGIYAKWHNKWCMGADGVIDPMKIQSPSFEYFPVKDMREKLIHDGRLEQLADLDNRLKISNRNKEMANLLYSKM